jgi:ABC-type metal ion transport system substrate-binding protein
MRQEKSVDFNVFEHVVFSENDEENPNKKLVIC